MKHRRNNHKLKNIKRCMLTGRRIDNKEVIIADEKIAIDYVRQLGYRVIPIRMENVAMVLSILFVVFGAIVWMGVPI